MTSNEPTGPRTWREYFARSYHYADDLHGRDGRAGRGPRGTIARATGRRRWRHDDKAARRQFRRQWLADERRREPVAGLGVAIVLIVLILFAGGLILSRILGGGNNGANLAPAITSSTTTAESPTSSGANAPTPTASTPTPTSGSPSPPTTAPVAALGVDAVIQQWATIYFTADIAGGQTQDNMLEAAAPYMTDELRTALVTAVDPAWQNMGDATVSVDAVTVAKPDPDLAPSDTPIRATRVVTVARTVAGGPYDGETWTDTSIVETALVDDHWLVSSLVAGGDH